MGSFELLTKFDFEYAPSSLKKWRSKRTGLQAVLISKDTPVVHGHFAVATEVEDDSGTPHTLEHLVFMGSAKYPYKGLLDTLGNVMFSNTNAWTATDQTVLYAHHCRLGRVQDLVACLSGPCDQSYAD